MVSNINFETLMPIVLTAALPHLSTAIRDAALEEVAKEHDGQAVLAKELMAKYRPENDPKGYCHQMARIQWNEHVASAKHFRALKGKSIPTPAEGNEAEAPAPAQAPGELVERLTRPIIGIENRSAQEAFNIMADRIRHAIAATPVHQDAGE